MVELNQEQIQALVDAVAQKLAGGFAAQGAVLKTGNAAELPKVAGHLSDHSAIAYPDLDSAVAAAKEARSDTAILDDDFEDEKPPAVDAPLLESEHILVDYLSLLPKANLATAGPRVETPR